MACMTFGLLILAALAGAAPELPPGADHRAHSAARSQAYVGVRIVAGARISASEIQDDRLPTIQATSIRMADGRIRAARLVEFE